MSGLASTPVFIRLYRRALRLLPQAFRETRGDAMLAMLEDEWKERGSRGRVAVALRASVDLIGTAVATRVWVDGAAGAWSGGVNEDLRGSLRSLTRAPLFTAAAVLSLALGVGGVGTVYAVADRLMLRPIGGVFEPQRLIELVPGGISYPAYQDFAGGMRSLDLAAHRMRPVALEPGRSAPPRPAQAALVSGNYFDVLGVSAALGRTLGESDNRASAASVTVLSNALWTELGRPDDVLGSTIRVNGTPYEVVGVAPADFTGLRLWVEPSLWITIESWPLASAGRTPDPSSRDWWWLQTVGRLQTGMTMAAATEDARSAAERIGEAYPDERGPLGGTQVVPLRTRAADSAGDVLGPMLLALAGVVALALLAAASNVANLLLARATMRGRELGIRAALGADRLRLGRLLAVESGVLVVAGLGVGFLLAALALRALATVQLPYGIGFEGAALRVDGRLLLLTAAMLAMVALVAGLSPALSASRTGPASLGSTRGATSGRWSLRLRGVFVSIQVMVGVVLLAGTALLGRSMSAAVRVDLGMDATRLGVIQVDASLFNEDAVGASQALNRLTQRLREEPGVDAASWSTVPPLTQGMDREGFGIVGRPWPEGGYQTVEVTAVGGEYFRTTRIRLVRGDVGGVDQPNAPVAVINEAMARRYWPDQDPIGARLQILDQEIPVVAVAADARLHGFASNPEPLVFGVLPGGPNPSVGRVGLTLLVAGEGTSAVLARAPEITRSLDARLVVADASSGAALIDLLLLPQRIGGAVFLTFALLALALALTGVYGVVAYGVEARGREFGVRLTLGARPARVTREVVRRNLRPVVLGLVLGALLSVALTRGAAAVLFGISASELGVPAAAMAAVLLMALLATWIPARRAGRVDPAAVLSAE